MDGSWHHAPPSHHRHHYQVEEQEPRWPSSNNTGGRAPQQVVVDTHETLNQRYENNVHDRNEQHGPPPPPPPYGTPVDTVGMYDVEPPSRPTEPQQQHHQQQNDPSDHHQIWNQPVTVPKIVGMNDNPYDYQGKSNNTMSNNGGMAESQSGGQHLGYHHQHHQQHQQDQHQQQQQQHHQQQHQQQHEDTFYGGGGYQHPNTDTMGVTSIPSSKQQLPPNQQNVPPTTSPNMGYYRNSGRNNTIENEFRYDVSGRVIDEPEVPRGYPEQPRGPPPLDNNNTAPPAYPSVPAFGVPMVEASGSSALMALGESDPKLHLHNHNPPPPPHEIATDPNHNNTPKKSPPAKKQRRSMATSWDMRYSELKEFWASRGHCLVSRNYPENPKLSKWVSWQRQCYKLRIEGRKSYMTDERITKLEELGFAWVVQSHPDARPAMTWDERLEDLKKYKVEFGNCLVPNRYKPNPPLGHWVSRQRNQYKLMKDGKSSTMDDTKISKLEAIGFVWVNNITDSWEQGLQELIEYRDKNGDCLVPFHFQENPRLGRWVNRQRIEYYKQVLTEEKIKRLEEEGFIWAPDVEEWNERFDELKTYAEKLGHCMIPLGFTPSPKLGKWVAKQRTLYRRKNIGEPSSMTPKQISLLEDVGFVWSVPHEKLWLRRLEELKLYKAKHGNTNVPLPFLGNPMLGEWVADQRKNYHLHKKTEPSNMTVDHLKKLEQAEFIWDLEEWLDWKRQMDVLLEYKRKKGNCHVPGPKCGSPDDNDLSKWVVRIRREYQKHKEGKPSYLDDTKIKNLEQEGFLWSHVRDNTWNTRYKELVEYKTRFGTCRVPNRWKENRMLGKWVQHQRRQFNLRNEGRHSYMTDEKVKKLEDLGFIWNCPPITIWDKKLEELKQYRDEFCDGKMPLEFDRSESLTHWVSVQRAQYKRMKSGFICRLTQEQIQRLEDEGFDWKDTWDTRLEELRAYKKEFGNCSVPKDYKEIPELGKFVQEQQLQYKTVHEGQPAEITMEKLMQLEEEDIQFSKSMDGLLSMGTVEGVLSSTINVDEGVEILGGEKSGEDTSRQENTEMDKSGEENAEMDKSGEDKSREESVGMDTSGEDKLGEENAEKDKSGKEKTREEETGKEKSGGDTSTEEAPANDKPAEVTSVEETSANDRSAADIPGKEKSAPDTSANDKSGPDTSGPDTLRKETSGPDTPVPIISEPGTPANDKSGEENTLTPSQPAGDEWDIRLKELQDYKKEHGDCEIPEIYPTNQPLSTWAARLKEHFRLMKEIAKGSKSTELRVKQLEALRLGQPKRNRAKRSIETTNSTPRRAKRPRNSTDSSVVDMADPSEETDTPTKTTDSNAETPTPDAMDSNAESPVTTTDSSTTKTPSKTKKSSPKPRSSGRKSKVGLIPTWAESLWNQRYAELVSFKEEKGHCVVPKKNHMVLGSWVRMQRHNYKLRKEGKHSLITPERIEKLETLGFIWNADESTSWEERLQQLKEYKEKHGNTAIPVNCPQNPQLGRWCAKQRSQYNVFKKNKRSSMTEERIKQMEEIGFKWVRS